jgi:LacI family transcriptional regulator
VVRYHLIGASCWAVTITAGMTKTVKLRDVADMAGVHPSTVSRALDPTKAGLVSAVTRARVKAAADELGYQGDAVASGLRRGRTNTVGIVVADIGNPFIAPVIAGVENSLDSRRFLAFVTETQDDHERLDRVLDHLFQRRVDAIITTAARSGDELSLRRAARRTPVILAIRDLPNSGLPGVTHDDELGGRLAADHLIGLGHRRLAQLEGPPDISSFAQRGHGFSARVRASSCECIAPLEPASRPTLHEGRRLMRAMLARERSYPTAVFVHNDLMAVGALQALSEAGLRCPEDMAVVGYNDAPLAAYIRPSLTTIQLPGYELGRFAADMALAQVDDSERAVTSISLPPRLIARESTLGQFYKPRNDNAVQYSS